MTDPLPHTVTVRARAKINVFLRILGRRSDGYHELETLIVPIDLADRLRIHADSGPEFHTLALSLEVTGDRELIRGVPVGGSNLILRAGHALADATGARGFAEVTLEKLVPAAAGLGGGSADAAATLRALNDLWGCGLDESALREVGQSIGSDIPALLVPGAAKVAGRGERVESIAAPSLSLALVTFPFGVSTADAFRWWDDDGGPTGPDPGPVLEVTQQGKPERLGRLVFNDLEDVVIRRHPVIGEARERLLDAGAAGVIMCGSGPSLAALVPSEGGFQLPEGLETRLVRSAANDGGSS
jgi:4-diphosphocytidyl-2-C-methyl-D-erythritol kinase